jgi:hypothetical protein
MASSGYEPELETVVSFRKRLRAVFVCTFLQFGALAGVPMLPRDIEELMERMNAPKLAHILPSEDEDTGGSRDPTPV